MSLDFETETVVTKASTTTVIAFPYAGAHSDPFHPLRRSLQGLPNAIELHTVTLPGHGRLLGAPPLRSVGDMADWAISNVDALTGAESVSLLGYSMGSLVAFEVARRLLDRGVSVDSLMVNAATPPHCITSSNLNIDGDSELISHCVAYGIMAPTDMQSTELRRLFLPTLRSDILAVDRYRFIPSSTPALDHRTRLHVTSGAVDPTVHDAERWLEVTSGHATYRVLPGGHFYLSESSHQFIGTIITSLEEK